MYKKIISDIKIKEPLSISSLKNIGYLLILLGIIGGIVLAMSDNGIPLLYSSTKTTFNWTIAVICWASGLISGALFIGFGKVIELLWIIANKDYIIVSDEQLDRVYKTSTKD